MNLKLPLMCVVLAWPFASLLHASETVYMKAEGLTGEVTEKGLEGAIVVEQFATELEKSTTGKLTSTLGLEKRPRSVKVLKALDKTTPRIAERIKESKPLAEVKFTFYRKNEAGELKHYFSMTLKNATIVGSRLHTSADHGGRALEELTIDYEDAELVSETGGEKYYLKK